MNKDIEGIPDGKFAPEDWEYMLLQMVNDHSRVDFGMYRMATFRRRYLKRMNLVDAQDIRDYVKMLENNTEQLDLLVSDLLIGVTSFFRDTSAFRVLKDSVIKPLFAEEGDEAVRVWVAGCSIGMEAYSIAMLMDSFSSGNGRNFTIFATDISRSALTKASKGIYTKKQFFTVPEEYRRYFRENDNGWKISRSIRSHMVFSYHDVLSDPPFAHMDLVSCRNMMIYLKPDAQDIVLGRLNYSLTRGGFLFLGSGETTGRKHSNLETIDSRWRIFKKVADTNISMNMFPLEKYYNKSGSTFSNDCFSEKKDDDVLGRSRSFTSCLEERFFPDCVFIDEDYMTLFINGDMNSYLSIPSGIPGGSLLPMLPSRLRAALRAGIRRATGGFRRIHCETGEGISIYVSCISPLGMKGVFLVEFVRDEPDKAGREAHIECSESDSSILEEQIALLDSELASTRRELRSRTGELQASNEELQTTNEEIRSANEELTASNEELIASNEELHRVNSQLSILSDDIMNLLESMDVGSLFLDSELNIRRFNPMIRRFFKITESDIGRAITDFTTTLAKSSLESLILAVREVAVSGIILEVSLDSDLFGYWLAKVSPYRTSDGSNQGTVITFIDITLLREGEISLAESERKYRGLFNGFPVGAILVSHSPDSSEFSILNKNPLFKLLQEKYSDLLSNQRFIQGITSEEPVFLFEQERFIFQGEVFKPADYAETLCVTLRDITVESRINHEKEILQKRLKDSQLLAGMGIWEYDPVLKTVTLSPEAAELFDLGSDLPVPVSVFRNLIEDFDNFFLAAQNALSTGETYSGMVAMHTTSSKSLKYFKVRTYTAAGNSRATVYGYVLDVSSEVNSERTLKKAHDRLFETQKIAKIGLIEIEWNNDCTSYRTRLSHSAIQVLKLSGVLHKKHDFFKTNMEEQLSERVLHDLKAAAKEQRAVTLDIPAKNGIGENIFLQIMARAGKNPDGSCYSSLVIMDITRRHQLENELKHSDKLRSVGELAGGIAHDFNNQLMGIVGFAECLRGLSCNSEQLEYIKGILNSAERAGALVRQLLAFSRKGLSHIAPFDLHHQIDDVISLLQRSIDRRIEIRRTLSAAKSIIAGDASEMNNALLNLAINARDAMDGGGTLTFSTTNPTAEKIKLVISDTGVGMAEEVMRRVFEPFFTTKPLGEGTGMGLSAVYGTVTAHQGIIIMESEPGQGTSAIVTLPVSESDAVGDGILGGHVFTGPMEGTILLVDDEKIVRTVLKTLMESLGFTVLTASDGVEAVELYSVNQNDIKLVLMDMTMPRKNGIEAFCEMREISPDVKVIILSGHSAESSSNEMKNLGISRVLQKPVTISVLSVAVKDVLGS
ncbi:MAG: response regulator [Candidatus Sabulitectum sp.]|nr:response regulator [Candidatus Sabulitectum sp.]